MNLKLKHLFWIHVALLFTICLAAVGCGAFARPSTRWLPGEDGWTRIPYQLVKSGSVQNIELRPVQVAPMSAESEAGWREAIQKWNDAGRERGVQLVETGSLMPWGTSPGVLIYDLEELQEGREGSFDWYAPGGEVLRARAYCAPVSKNGIRFGRYFRLHEIGHSLLLPHSTIPTAVMWPWRVDLLGAPSVNLTAIDRRDLARRYHPPP